MNNNLLKRFENGIWIHELYPIIDQVKIISNEPPGPSSIEIAARLNEKIKRPNLALLLDIIKDDYQTVFARKHVNDRKTLESVFEINKKHQKLK